MENCITKEWGFVNMIYGLASHPPFQEWNFVHKTR